MDRLGRAITSRRRLIFALLFVGLLAASALVAWDRSRQRQAVHHTVSITRRLVALQESSPDPIWILTTFRREIWIRLDGAGRIEQIYETSQFPTDDERAQAVAVDAQLPEPSSTGQTFGPGGLTYVSAADLRMRIDRLQSDEHTASQVMDLFGSYLTETVPAREAVDAAIHLADGTDGVEVDRAADITVSAIVNGRRVKFTFDSASLQLKSETFIGISSLEGLDLPPPILLLEQRFTQVEDLPDWLPPE